MIHLPVLVERRDVEHVVFALLVLAVTIYAALRIRSLEHRNGELALSAYNTRAALDSTKAVALNEKKRAELFGQHTDVVERLAVQVTRQRDSVDKALKVEHTLRASLEATIKTLSASATSSVATDSNDTRSATFHVDSQPFTVDAAVSLPRIGQGRIDLTAKVAPARIGLRSTCGPADATGIRPVRIIADSPDWLTLTIVNADQDKDVCRSPALIAGAKGFPWKTVAVLVSSVYLLGNILAHR